VGCDEDDVALVRREGGVECLLARSELGTGGRRERQSDRRIWRRRNFAKMAGRRDGEDRHRRHSADRDPGD
jgi:hypothetical protein